MVAFDSRLHLIDAEAKERGVRSRAIARSHIPDWFGPRRAPDKDHYAELGEE